MTSSLLLRTAIIAIYAGSFATTGRSETHSLKIAEPVAVAARAESSAIYVATKQGQLIEWNDGQQSVLVPDLAAEPALLTEVQFLFCREGSISALGLRDADQSLASFRYEEMPKERSVRWVPGIAGPIPYATGKVIRNLAATASAMYTAVSGDSEHVLWRTDLRVATMGDPVKLHVGEAEVLAIAVNYQGHLIAAIRDPSSGGKVALRFHHALAGSDLLQLPTELDDVSSLVVGPDELLYASGRLGSDSGVFRIDVVYRNLRQATTVGLIVPNAGVRQIACNDEYLIMVDKDDVTRIKLDTIEQ